MKASEWFKRNGGKWVTPVKQAASLARAVAGKRADGAVFSERMTICMKCGERKDVNGKHYCGACGCPKWKLSELGQKLRFSGYHCPAGKF